MSRIVTLGVGVPQAGGGVFTVARLLAASMSITLGCSSPAESVDSGTAADVGVPDHLGPLDAGDDSPLGAQDAAGDAPEQADATSMDTDLDSGVDAGPLLDAVLMMDAGLDALADAVALADGSLMDATPDAASDGPMDVAVSDVGGDVGLPDVPVVLPPRLLAPLSGGRISNRRPNLRWVAPAGVTHFRVDLCTDRACTHALASLTTTDSHVQPATALPAGVVFWRVTGVDGAGATVWTSATWEFVAPRRDAPIDTAWGVLKDFNGDGFADVAVGDSAGAGSVYAFAGQMGSLGPLQWTENTPDMLNGIGFGQSIAGAGDVNGDGFGDLIVGARNARGRGFLFLGSATFLPTDPSRIFAPAAAPPPHPFWEFGVASASVGDVNGDGFGDFVFGASGQDCVYLGLGGASEAVTVVQLDGSMYSVPADLLFAGFGYSIAGAGDLDGDGYGDLVVGAPNIAGGTGTAFIFYGGPDGVAPHPDLQLGVPSGAGGFYALPVQGVGDLNGDHLGDMAIGSEGSVAVYYGRSDRHLETPDLMLSSVDPGGGIPELAFGTVLGAPGDLNGDGYADLIVGAPRDGVDGRGRVYIYFGGASGLSMIPQEVHGSRAPVFGIGVACTGDVDGDGYEDMAVGSMTTAGEDYLSFFPGGPLGPWATPTEIGPYFGNFGASVASWEGQEGATAHHGREFCERIAGTFQASWLWDSPQHWSITLHPAPPIVWSGAT